MKNKKAEKLALIPICIVVGLMLVFLFCYVYKADGQEKTYLVGVSHFDEYPEYLASDDSLEIDSFIKANLDADIDLIKMCNRDSSYVYFQTKETSVYLVSGIMKKKKNGKEKFIAMVPARGVRRDNVERKNKRR